MAVPTELCRAEGPVGEFLRQAGLQDHWVTSSGYMNCVSAAGTYLGRRPSPEVLEAFRQLPEAERTPGSVAVPDLDPADEPVPSPPPGGLVVKVHARFLSRTDDGPRDQPVEKRGQAPLRRTDSLGDSGGDGSQSPFFNGLRYVTTDDFPLMRDPEAFRLFLEPNTESLWLTEDEWRSLVPADPVVGEELPVEPAISDRLARFHLTPRRAMTSENGILPKQDVRSAALRLTVEDANPELVRLRLTGQVRTGTEFDAEGATTPNGPLGFGYATPLHGVLEYDRRRDSFVRFDIVAPGEVWGRWGDANNNSLFVERPGRTPFAFAFELAAGDSPTHRLPPGGHGGRALQRGYFDTGE